MKWYWWALIAVAVIVAAYYTYTYIKKNKATSGSTMKIVSSGPATAASTAANAAGSQLKAA